MIEIFWLSPGDETFFGVKLDDEVIGVVYRLDEGKAGEPHRWAGTARICGLEEFPTLPETLEYIQRTYKPESDG
jgi:hypothetical protein